MSNDTAEDRGSGVLLSVCIATFKRAEFLAATLDSIVEQLEGGVELVIVDGASPDRTPAVVAPYLARFPAIRYFREEENSGVDRDYDKAVGYARGEYCWLMTDDDLLKPGAIRRVLGALREEGRSLILVNAEVRNADLSQILVDRKLPMPRGSHLRPRRSGVLLRRVPELPVVYRLRRDPSDLLARAATATRISERCSFMSESSSNPRGSATCMLFAIRWSSSATETQCGRLEGSRSGPSSGRDLSGLSPDMPTRPSGSSAPGSHGSASRCSFITAQSAHSPWTSSGVLLPAGPAAYVGRQLF